MKSLALWLKANLLIMCIVFSTSWIVSAGGPNSAIYDQIGIKVEHGLH